MLLNTLGLAVIVVDVVGAVLIWNPLHPVGRVVGGKVTSIFKHPHQVALEMKQKNRSYVQFCGGSIIHMRWILTAAHCVSGLPVDILRIRIGSSHRLEGGFIHYIEKAISHSKFDYSAYDWDIAVVKVTAFINYANNIKPILMVHKAPPPKSTVTTTGWGTLSENGVQPKDLMEVELKVVDTGTCHERNHMTSPVTETMICAGDFVNNRGSCNGDSGGPLIYNNKLAGIVSWVPVCGTPQHPTVYSDVAYFRPWISLVTNVEFY